MLQTLRFQLEAHSPLLVGGGERAKADPMGITGKALRGAWRFWFRALYSGLGFSTEDCQKTENEIFGSTQKRGFRLQIIPLGEFSTTTIDRFPHKKGEALYKNALKQALYEIVIRHKDNYEYADILKATIVLWGCLGSIGSRSRKGFGSCSVEFDEKSILEFCEDSTDSKWLKQLVGENSHTCLDFANYDAFCCSFKSALNLVFKVFVNKFCQDNQEKVIKQWLCTSKYDSVCAFFQLSSLNQIYMQQSQDISNDNNLLEKNGLLDKLHGSSRCSDLGYIQPNRYSSPFYSRVFKLNTPGNDNQEPRHIAICTFCPTKDGECINGELWKQRKGHVVPWNPLISIVDERQIKSIKKKLNKNILVDRVLGSELKVFCQEPGIRQEPVIRWFSKHCLPHHIVIQQDILKIYNHDPGYWMSEAIDFKGKIDSEQAVRSTLKNSKEIINNTQVNCIQISDYLDFCKTWFFTIPEFGMITLKEVKEKKRISEKTYIWETKYKLEIKVFDIPENPLRDFFKESLIGGTQFSELIEYK